MLGLELEFDFCASRLGHLVAATASNWALVGPDAPAAAPPSTKPHGPAPFSLALSETDLRGQTPGLKTWCEQLLPEAELLAGIARRLGISSGNSLALLSALGGDCAGGVSFHPAAGTTRGDETGVRHLNDEELRHLVAALAERPHVMEVEGLRYLLPGSRPKMPVCRDEQGVGVRLGTGLCSHILKINDTALRDLVLNEWLCMRLAGLAGLRVAKVELLRAYVTLLLVERIDRVRDAEGRVQRMHMEDFCQIAVLDPVLKFEREGGLGAADCASLIRRYSVLPGVDLREFIRWLLFGFLVGYGGGHAKQLVMMHTAKGPRLGPFFGIWSWHVYPALSDRLAMAIGREDRPDWIHAARWRELGQQIGVKPAYVLELLAHLAGVLPALWESLIVELGMAARSPVIDALGQLIAQRCRQALVSLAAERA